MAEGYQALTEKEKATLRLLLDGHDAKSMARHFDLSVHTINERLRDARRKLSVSSSREAARVLLEHERAAPENSGDRQFGDAPPAAPPQLPATPADAPPSRRARVIGGLAILSILLAALALAPTQAPPAATPAEAAAETEATRAARTFLELGDAGRWPESYAATGASFRAANTLDGWRAASQRARVPLGRVLSRTLVDDIDTPAPPNGLRTVRFRTDFEHRRGATETLSLDREGDAWRVVGIYIG